MLWTSSNLFGSLLDDLIYLKEDQFKMQRFATGVSSLLIVDRMKSFAFPVCCKCLKADLICDFYFHILSK